MTYALLTWIVEWGLPAASDFFFLHKKQQHKEIAAIISSKTRTGTPATRR